MKTKSKSLNSFCKAGLILLFLLLINIPATAGNGNEKKKAKNEVFSLTINGLISNVKELENKNCLVELYCYTEKIDSVIVNSKGFHFVLDKNKYYTIKISQKQCVTKLISIDTETPEMINNKHIFQFETSMLKEADATKLDKMVLDFPAALIMYYEGISGFEFCLEYDKVRNDMLKHGKDFHSID
ncbi:MAG: hypothetical protein IPM51_04755 [Sphingobacteriaceae bacterium]|nr:hypothetical protein [Sphingobacteriaceae bacterium]